MSKQLLSDVADKSVVSAQGQDIGKLSRITFNPMTGALEDLIIDPIESPVSSKKLSQTNDGLYKCPFYLIDGVDNVIVVNI